MSKNKLRVFSYNIHKGFTATNSTFVLDRIKESIESFHADIVFLQEVLGHHESRRSRIIDWPTSKQFEYLADRLWPHHAYGKNAVYSEEHHGNAILSKYPILRWENIDISTNPFEQRGILHAVLEYPRPGAELHVICLHLGLFESGRRQQIKELVKLIDGITPVNSLLIIAGDFNDWLEKIIIPVRLKLKEAHFSIYGKHARTLHVQTLKGKPWTELSDHLAISATLVPIVEESSLKSNQIWNKEEIFFESFSFFKHLEKGLSEAKYSIDIETYIFENDKLGQEIANQLRAASKRGIRVRIMVDGFGSSNWSSELTPLLCKDGVELRIFHPLPWRAVGSTLLFKLPSILRFLKRVLTLNERNHRKVCIVDGYKAWTGGMNISSAHAHWRDTGIYIEGESVQILLEVYLQTWNKAWGQLNFPISHHWRGLRHSLSTSLFVRLNANYRTRRDAYNSLLEKIQTARVRIFITNPYFAPPRTLLRALSSAAMRGVEIRILVPAVSDVLFIHAISSALYYGLLKSGVRMFEFISVPLHSKTLLIDNWATIGTTNLNHRSILHDLEIDIVLDSMKSIQKLSDKFNDDLTNAKEFKLSDWDLRSWKERLIGRILLLFRYWI